MESAGAVVRCRAEGDLRDASERLAEERERFKMQLGIAHAVILKLKTELAELERRNRDLEVRQAGGDISRTLGDISLNLGDGNGRPGDRSVCCVASGLKSHDDGVWSASESVGARGTAEPVQRGGEGASTERVEKEIQSLRKVCRGLERDLKASLRTEKGATQELQALVQVSFASGLTFGSG